MLSLLGVACGLVVLGCGRQPDREETITETAPAKVAFEGKADSSLAGTYKSSDGKSVYVFDPSGKFALKGKVHTQGGTFDNEVKGSWAVDGDRMLFKYGDDNVVPYKMTKSGNTLKLALTGSMKRETVLVKQ